MTQKIRKPKKKPVKHKATNKEPKLSDNVFLYTVFIVVPAIVILMLVL
ncbi:MAG: hypothetical protein P8M49_09840 [Thalassotalea sp.]|nr:hypothetical protein [Thalassotalea sp.]MDG2393802.1 hypothetical protein [Thalassotalea sp.]